MYAVFGFMNDLFEFIGVRISGILIWIITPI